MRSIEVSIGFIEQNGTFLLQRRSPRTSLGAAGLIGAFGGTIEKGETPLEAVCRELGEETSLNPSTEDFRYLGSVEVISDRDHESVKINAAVYAHKIPVDKEVIALDGELVRMTKEEANGDPEALTPATKEAFRILL